MSAFLYLKGWLKRFKQRLSGPPQSEHCAALAERPADLPQIGDNAMTSTPTTEPTEDLATKTTPSIAQQRAATTGVQISMNDQTPDTAVTPAPAQNNQAAQAATTKTTVKTEQDSPVRSVSVHIKHTENSEKSQDSASSTKDNCNEQAIPSAESSTAAPAHPESISAPPPVAKKTAAKTTVEPESVIKTKITAQAKSSQAAKAAPEAKPQAKHEPATEPALKTESEPAPEEATQAPALTACEPDQHWQACYEAVTGLAHRDANPPLPCQDSAIALNSQRPIVIVADGAGSSAVSELGAQAVTTGLARLLNTLERQVTQLLDQPQSSSNEETRSFALLLVKHAKGILDDLAVQHRRPQKDFRCTLLLAIQGKAQLLWLKIGDGALVIETLQQDAGKLLPTLATLGSVGKGEFANATTFIDDHLQPTDVQTGSCNSADITGFAAMSDGAADRLVANDGSQVSPQISDWLNKLRQGNLKRRELTRLFSSENFTRGTTGDDASVALCASGLKTDAAATAGKP